MRVIDIIMQYWNISFVIATVVVAIGFLIIYVGKKKENEDLMAMGYLVFIIGVLPLFALVYVKKYYESL